MCNYDCLLLRFIHIDYFELSANYVELCEARKLNNEFRHSQVLHLLFVSHSFPKHI